MSYLGIALRVGVLALLAFVYAWGAHWHVKYADLAKAQAVAVAAAASAAAAESKRNAEAYVAEQERIIKTQSENLNAQAQKLEAAMVQSGNDAVVAQRLRDALIAARRPVVPGVPGVPQAASAAAASPPTFGASDVAAACVSRLAELARASRAGVAAGDTCVGAYEALRP